MILSHDVCSHSLRTIVGLQHCVPHLSLAYAPYYAALFVLYNI